jgi:hypothetical protein
MADEREAALTLASTFHLGSPLRTITVFLLELFASPIPYHCREDLFSNPT